MLIYRDRECIDETKFVDLSYERDSSEALYDVWDTIIGVFSVEFPVTPKAPQNT